MIKNTELPARKTIRLSRPAYKKGHAFFLTIRTHKGYPWFEKEIKLTGFIEELLIKIVKERDATLYAWCIMPNHIHLLVQDEDIIDFIRLLKGKATPYARKICNGKKLWQRSFYDHALRDQESLTDLAQYIFENPVRKELVTNPHEYIWSGSEVWRDWRKFYIK